MRKLIFVGLLLLSIHQSAAQTETVYAIVGGTIIDGTGSRPIEDGLVVVVGERITAVGDSDSVVVPADAVIIDVSGRTVLPGIINAHSHWVVLPDERFELFTRAGVTGICDMAMALPYMFYASPSFSRTADGIFAGRFGVAGPIITAPGGYPGPVWGRNIGYEVDTPEAAASAVLDVIDKGATHIKIALETGSVINAGWPLLTLEQVQAITTAAHEQGVLVHAHVQEAESLERALDGGVDVIQHTPIPTQYSEWSNSDALQAFYRNLEGDAPLPDELVALLRRMVEEDTMLVPTLDVIIGVSRTLEDTADFQPYAARFHYIEGMTLAVVQAFYDLGGRIGLGNDYGNTGVLPGMPLVEMLLLEEAGLSPMKVIIAGTQTSAAACGMPDVGTLEAGQYADLIVVDGDPLLDLTVMVAVKVVMMNGEIVVNDLG